MAMGANIDLRGLLTAKAAKVANPATWRTPKADIGGLLTAKAAKVAKVAA
ncbi:hypothetical protein [Acidiphilium sp.]|nr:hypothetical protein [Acidiphilium sp.]